MKAGAGCSDFSAVSTEGRVNIMRVIGAGLEVSWPTLYALAQGIHLPSTLLTLDAPHAIHSSLRAFMENA